MIKRKQLYRKVPGSGVAGDCHRTAIACLLDLEPEQVPHFAQDCFDGEVFYWRVMEWLFSRGYCDIEMPFKMSLEDLLRCQRVLSPGVCYLLSGKSRSGCGHTVIGCGGEIIWDPSPDNVGIVAPFDSDRSYWVSWLTPLAMKVRVA